MPTALKFSKRLRTNKNSAQPVTAQDTVLLRSQRDGREARPFEEEPEVGCVATRNRCQALGRDPTPPKEEPERYLRRKGRQQQPQQTGKEADKTPAMDRDRTNNGSGQRRASYAPTNRFTSPNASNFYLTKFP